MKNPIWQSPEAHAWSHELDWGEYCEMCWSTEIRPLNKVVYEAICAALALQFDAEFEGGNK